MLGSAVLGKCSVVLFIQVILLKLVRISQLSKDYGAGPWGYYESPHKIVLPFKFLRQVFMPYVHNRIKYWNDNLWDVLCCQ